MSLDELVRQLTQVHGSALVGVVLYGSAASDDVVEGLSDLNVLVIVETLDITTLRALGQTTRAWQEAGNPPPLMLTRTEWLGSSDVFPMEYADILERHRVLAGTMPLDGVVVHQRDLRLQVEQESLGKLLRLRRAVMTAGTDVARQRELLRASLSAVLVIFRSVLRLHGERPSRDGAHVIADVATHCRLDAQPFLRVHQLVHGGALADSDVASVMAGYLDGVTQLARVLDTMRIPDA
ncbi:MAG: hypothetical protein KA154_14035 [Gemmatimonadaceae bacterium]|nr:hypothetical protein [Gemmatimonadaceae bacterium]MCC6431046.1 hypothetical protein [Gemmatimonadaceae bacterium]